ncbi:AIPR family protein, partial [Priestia megaterium]
KLDDLSSQNDAEREKSFLSRALAAYSISVLYSNVEKENVAKYLVDGSEDNGIDLIYYHHDTNELCLVQSKFNHAGSSEPDLGEVQKFVTGVRDLINLKFDKFNNKVNSIKDEIVNTLKKSKLKFKIILAYTAINLSKHAKREFSDLLDDLNDHREVAELEIMNQKRFHASLHNHGTSRTIDIEINLREWGRFEGEMEAFYGQISGDELADLWESYGNTLFDHNIRKVLGTTEINKEMQQTLDTESELFWYYNNGITLVCEEVDKKRIYGNMRSIGLFECKGISIVNGAQTVGVIGKHGQASDENKNKLKEVFIPFRIISINRTDEDGKDYLDEVFASEVTTKNNRQNSIGSRDFVVLDPIQRKIERDLSLIGVTYHLMRSEEEENIGDQSFNLREATRALSFAADIDATIAARREISTIYDDLNSSKYKKLYNPSVTSYYVWNCVRIQRIINGVLDSFNETDNLESAILIYGKEIMSRIIFEIIGVANIDKYSLDIEKAIGYIDIREKISLLLNGLKAEIATMEKDIVNIFKSPNDMKSLYGKMKILLETEQEEEPSVNEETFEVSNIENLSRIERLQLQNFYKKIQGDEIAVEFFEKWAKDIFKPEQHSIGYRSNIHFYKSEPNVQATDRFLFRIAYYTKLIVSFEFNAFASNYTSVLYEQEGFNDWAKENMDSKN